MLAVSSLSLFHVKQFFTKNAIFSLAKLQIFQ
jgi:hypothetical protein